MLSQCERPTKMSPYQWWLHYYKEMAFKRWQESGYRDKAAREEFIHYYEQLQRPFNIFGYPRKET